MPLNSGRCASGSTQSLPIVKSRPASRSARCRARSAVARGWYGSDERKLFKAASGGGGERDFQVNRERVGIAPGHAQRRTERNIDASHLNPNERGYVPAGPVGRRPSSASETCFILVRKADIKVATPRRSQLVECLAQGRACSESDNWPLPAASQGYPIGAYRTACPLLSHIAGQRAAARPG